MRRVHFLDSAVDGHSARWFSAVYVQVRLLPSPKLLIAITMFMILLIGLAFFICFQGKNYDRIGFRGDSIGFTSNR